MQGEDSLGSDIFHMPQEVVIARMVGKREGSIAAHAVNGACIHRPARDSRNTPLFHQGHGFASGAGGRADEDMARRSFCVPWSMLGKNDAFGFIDRHEFGNGGVEHDPQACLAQVRQDFLGFPQRVSEQNGRRALLERFDAKLQDLRHDLLKGREHIAGKSVGGLHDECFGMSVGRRFGTGALPEFEVARVEEASLVGLHKTLGGSQNMPGRQQAHAEFPKVASFSEGQGNRLAVQGAHSRLHETKGRRCGDGALVASGVVAVGVRNEGQRLGIMRIQPEIGAGQVDGPSVPDLDHRRDINSSSLCPSVCGRSVPMVKRGYDPQGDLSPQ